MPKFKVTLARTYIVEAKTKVEAEELVKNGQADYDGSYTYVREAESGWGTTLKKQLTGQ